MLTMQGQLLWKLCDLLLLLHLQLLLLLLIVLLLPLDLLLLLDLLGRFLDLQQLLDLRLLLNPLVQSLICCPGTMTWFAAAPLPHYYITLTLRLSPLLHHLTLLRHLCPC